MTSSVASGGPSVVSARGQQVGRHGWSNHLRSTSTPSSFRPTMTHRSGRARSAIGLSIAGVAPRHVGEGGIGRRSVRRRHRADEVRGPRRPHTAGQLGPGRGLAFGGVGAVTPPVPPVGLGDLHLAVGQRRLVRVDVDLVRVDAHAQLGRCVGRPDVAGLEPHRQQRQRHRIQRGDRGVAHGGLGAA